MMLLGVGAVATKTYVDDVFSTFLYKGNGVWGNDNTGSQTITNGIDNSKGGLLWTKARSASESHTLFDTERASNKAIYTNLSSAEGTRDFNLNFLSNGFSWNTYDGMVNDSNQTYASFNFRKAKGFFDIVTYSGNGSARTIAHSLSCVPGCIMVKRITGGNADWVVYHASIGATKFLKLNSSDAAGTSSDHFNNTAPTASVFSVGGSDETNEGSSTYVAYLFADGDESAAQIFGENSDKSIIKMGTYTGNGSSDGPTVNLGWEPSYTLIKQTTQASNWRLHDSMRGIVTGGDDAMLRADTNQAEVASGKDRLELNPTGFKLTNSDTDMNQNGATYAYMCIRRPDGYVGKPPELGTGAFSLTVGTGGTAPQFVTGFPMDFALYRRPADTQNWYAGSRLTGDDYLFPNLTNAAGEASWLYGASDHNNGWAETHYSSTSQAWSWKRGAGFDVVAYKGDGTAGHQILHSLNKIPEMIWCKRRDSAGGWFVYHKGLDGGNQPETHYLYLNLSDAEGDQVLVWNDTAPTSSRFTVGSHSDINANNGDYIAMLFASVDGISKVGYYTGTGSTQTITTGFQPRFAIIKRVNATQHWYVFDTTRGWASGNDQYIKLDLTDAQAAADLGQPISTGFQVGSDPTVGASGDKYIYYAHA